MTYNSFPFSFWLLYNSHAYCMMHSFRNNSFCTNFIDFVVTSDTTYVSMHVMLRSTFSRNQTTLSFDSRAEWSKPGCCGIKLSLVGKITSLVLLKLHTQRRPIYFVWYVIFSRVHGLYLNCILSFLLQFFLLGKQSRKKFLTNQPCARGLHKQGHFSPTIKL